MNWIMTLLFLPCIMFIYYKFGKYILHRFDIKNDSDSKSIITGFICLTTFQWCIAFPCQILHVSWNIYFFLLLFAYLILLLFLFKCGDSKILDKRKLILHFKNYWFLYLIVVPFAIFSMANQLAYYEMNYDDSYYLGALVQNVGADRIASVNYFNGAPEGLTFARLLNTYEIGYSFWGSLLHIDLSFFARVTMVIHNYIIVFMASHMLLKRLFKEEKYCQFSLAAYLLLLIPAGYLEQRNIIRMYDGWQFNTAVWYGSSIVRLTALPILLTFAIDYIKDRKWKALIIICIGCISMMSFSSISVSYFALFLIIMITILMLIKIKSVNGKKQKMLYSFILLAIWMILMAIHPVLSYISPTFDNNMQISQTQYVHLRDTLVNANRLLKIMVIYSCITAFVIKEKTYRVISLFAIIGYVLFKFDIFDHLVLLTTINEYFAALRFLTSIQLLMILLVGYSGVKVISRVLDYNSFIILSSLLILVFVNYNIGHLDAYTKKVYRGSGLSTYGYDFQRIFNNDGMRISISNDLTDYFNTLSNNNRRIAAPYQIVYDDVNVNFYTELNSISNNLEVCTTDRVSCNNMSEKEKLTIVQCLIGELPADEMLEILDKYGIRYVITLKEDVKTVLEEHNFTLELESRLTNGNHVYLMQMNY